MSIICSDKKIVSLLLCLLALTAHVHAQRTKKTNTPPAAFDARMQKAESLFTDAEKYYILEDYSKALVYYERTLEMNPDNPTVYYKIAEILSRSNKQEDLLRASTNIEKALRLDRSNKYFYTLAAAIYTAQARFDKAAATYEALFAEVKGTEEHLFDLAAVYQYANKPEDAIGVYNRAETFFGTNEVSSVQKIKLFLDAGKNKDAYAEGEKLMAAFPDDEHYVMAFAQVLSQKNLNEQAIHYLEKYAAQNTESGNAKMLLAGLYRDANQEAKARPLLLALFDDSSVEFGGKLIILGAYSSELNQTKAKNSRDKDKEEFAVRLFEKLQKNYPEESGVHIVGGDLYIATGKEREAQIEYAKAIAAGNVNFEVWENLLFLDIQLEQYDQALKHSDQALELFPNQGIIYYFNGFANLRKRRFAEAIESFEQARKLAASRASLVADIDAMLGDAYNANKEYEKSDRAYDAALQFNPNNSMVLNNYSYYLAQRRANLEKAEKMSSLLVKNNPDNPSFLDTHAWVLFMREKYKEARKVMERALSTGKASAVHFEHYGDILFKLGDVDGAVQQWEKARGLNANSELLNKKIANRKIYE